MPTSFLNTNVLLSLRIGSLITSKRKSTISEMTHVIHNDLSVDILETYQSSMLEFDITTEDEILTILKSTSTSSCDLDPMPVPLLKKCLSELLPVMTKIVNESLQSGVVPVSLKQAVMIPKLKKPGLSPEELANYRPISNISHISKVIEKVAVTQIQEYLTSHDLLPQTQSAYRSHHSVETALLRINNDILIALDKHLEAILVQLDFTAAFDTIDHPLLLDRLFRRYGLAGTVLSWFRSYFSQRSHVVKVGTSTSRTVEDTCGVAQGSITGPLTFTLYTAPINDIISAHKLSSMIYADDTQIYAILYPSERNAFTDKLNACIKDIRSWAVRNQLAINDKKTEVTHFSSRFLNRPNPSVTLMVGDTNITASAEARNLGVSIDHQLTMKTQVKNICRSSMAAIRKIGQIRMYLDTKTTKKLVHAFVISRLDSCNSLLSRLPDSEINKLQRIQNTVARMIEQSRRSDHISPILLRLHWLPVKKTNRLQSSTSHLQNTPGQSPFISM